MPYTMNGIGTWYWGKDRIQRKNGRCEYCGNYGELSSYDTTLFFVVIFIPVIPLGRKRVLNECSKCHKHNVAPLSKWTEAQDKAILEADQAAMADPKSEEKAAAAIVAAVSFQAQDEFELLARKYGQKFPRGPMVQAVLGDTYQHFGKPVEAEQAYLASLQGKDEPQVHQALGILLARQNRPDEAEAHVQHVIDQKLSDRRGVPLLVAAAYQQRGRHDDALRLLESSVAAFPELANDQDFIELQKTSQKHRATGKAVKGKYVGQLVLPTVRCGGWRAKLPRLIPTAILAIALAWYLGSAIKLGISRPVHVVNGLDRAYVSEINGQTVSIGPHQWRVINVAEGDVTVRLADDSQAATHTVRIHTGFFTRPFDTSVHVINPDGTALLVREETTYSSYSGTAADNPYTLHVGDFYYQLPAVDYLFEPFPESIQSSDKSRGVTKTRLELVRELEPTQIVLLLLGRKEKDRGFTLISNRLAVDPDDETLLLVAVQMMPPDRVEAMLKTRLASRPLLLQWHRAYQELMERTHPDLDLHAEYDRLLKAEPQNAELAYLLGRVTEDRGEARTLFEKAANAPKPVAFAWHALGYEALIHAEFPSSLEMERKALSLSPENETFQAAERDVLVALGKFDELLKRVRADLAKTPLNADAVTRELYLMACMNDFAAADRRAQEYYDKIRRVTGEQELINLRARNGAMLAYLRGDMAEYQRNLRALPAGSEAIESGIEFHQFDGAMKALNGAPGAGAESYALIYLAATEAKDDAAAKAALTAAINALAAGDKAERNMARWLKGEAAPTPQELADLSMSVSSKRVLLAALGLKVPATRDQSFALSRKLNYQQAFPYRLIDRITAAK